MGGGGCVCGFWMLEVWVASQSQGWMAANGRKGFLVVIRNIVSRHPRACVMASWRQGCALWCCRDLPRDCYIDTPRSYTSTNTSAYSPNIHTRGLYGHERHLHPLTQAMSSRPVCGRRKAAAAAGTEDDVNLAPKSLIFYRKGTYVCGDCVIMHTHGFPARG